MIELEIVWIFSYRLTLYFIMYMQRSPSQDISPIGIIPEAKNIFQTP
jgi:hypothetical protein